MQVQEIMTRGADVIDPHTTIREAAKKMRADNVGALPVCDGERLLGMVTDRDIVVRAVASDQSSGTTAVSDVMSDHVYCCFEDDDAEGVAEKMAEHQIRRLPVLDRDHRLVGMVALADLGRSDGEAAETALGGVSEPTDVPRR